MLLLGKQKLAIDLGSATTLIYLHKKGIALREPSILAVKKETNEIVAFGQEARHLEGRTSDKYEIIRPVQGGVIQSFNYTKEMLHHFLRQAIRRSVSSPEVVINVPAQITKVERRAVVDAIRDLGIRRAMLVDSPYAVATGMGLAIDEPRGRLIVDLGEGSLDIATLSFGEIINKKTVNCAGEAMTRAIQQAVHEHYRLAISYEQAERLKIEIGNASYTDHDASDHLIIKGRSLTSGLPVEERIHARLVSRALEEVIEEIFLAIRQVLEMTPPELSADIADSGIILSGGGALLKRLPERMGKHLGLNVHIAQAPLDSVVLGLGKLLKDIDRASYYAERQGNYQERGITC